MNKFVFTCGDINGIGPEIVIKTLNKVWKQKPDKFFFICPDNIFLQTIKKVKTNFKFEIIDDVKNYSSRIAVDSHKIVSIINIGSAKQKVGFPTIESGKTSFHSINLSFDLADKKFVDAIITSPISKTALKMAGINFPGHTEMFAEWSNASNFAMTFLSSKMNAALITIHEPLEKVTSFITIDSLQNKFDVIIKMLKEDLLIKSPAVAVLGLNPHAGESGYIGREEEEIIKPVIQKKKYSKYFFGPFPADAFFANRLYQKYDLVLGMYHDQALIPFKLLNFGKGVNYTAGLPIVRASPDHGTAYDIAGKYIADESSMVQAYYYAKKIVNNRKSNQK
ncbi:MAG: 4-hydroxythreonine-4-phosphate dehydrogenase PdxA [Ignavibacteriaceae bacterium]